MSAGVWDGGGPVLVDTSAWMQARYELVDVLHFDQHLERLGEHLEVASHWISRR
jgi:hypothetical protein